MDTKQIPTNYQHISPAGAEVRLLMNSSQAGLAHCTLKRGKISKSVHHKTVSEFWHVISGQGEIWRRNNSYESITKLEPGTTIDIPLSTDFQYRSANDSDLVFICFTIPPWPGEAEISYVHNGAWESS